jgi:hypothetical protein
MVLAKTITTTTTKNPDMKTSETELEDQDMNPCSSAHLIFDKVAKSIGWRKDSLFSKCCQKNGYLPAEN